MELSRGSGLHQVLSGRPKFDHILSLGESDCLLLSYSPKVQSKVNLGTYILKVTGRVE